jgi:signal transduction histidine kinase
MTSVGPFGAFAVEVGSMLYEFLFANREAILARARKKVAGRAAPRPTEEELTTGIPLFFDQLTSALRPSSHAAGAIGVSATVHGGNLLDRGFTIGQVVHDYGGVCQAATELADEMKASITAAEFHTFNACLDDAIAEAVTEYGRRREQTLTEEGRARSGELIHELRNAVGSAMLAFESISSRSVGPSGSTSALLGRSLRRLADLIGSSVAQVRLEAGLQKRKPVSLRDFIEEVEVGAAMEAAARGLTLAVTPPPAGIELNVDVQLLAAAVSNLLQNAFKFTHTAGHVTLKTSSTDDRVLIEVEDQCGGLPAGKAEELFRRFEQRGPDRSGLGLGLSISRRSVEADGGTIRVRDVRGVGCVFTIDLPRFRSDVP